MLHWPSVQQDDSCSTTFSCEPSNTKGNSSQACIHICTNPSGSRPLDWSLGQSVHVNRSVFCLCFCYVPEMMMDIRLLRSTEMGMLSFSSMVYQRNNGFTKENYPVHIPPWLKLWKALKIIGFWLYVPISLSVDCFDIELLCSRDCANFLKLFELSPLPPHLPP